MVLQRSDKYEAGVIRSVHQMEGNIQPMSDLYPIFTDIYGRSVIVIGGGRIAERKVAALLEAGGRVTVISPTFTDPLIRLGETGQIQLIKRSYREGDLEGAWLVIAATGDEQVNRTIHREAQTKQIFCNVVDVPDLCSFQVPAVIRRGSLQIAVSTGGLSPALARQIRLKLQDEYGEHYELFLAGLGELRFYYKQKYPGNQKRRAELLEGFINTDALDWLRRGDNEQFRQLVNEWKER